MRIFLVFVLFVILGFGIYAQSPHGSDFSLDCSDCHSELQWAPLSETIKFNHSSTGFELTGQHKTVGCNSCHETLVFNKAEQNCLSCHKDIHQNSVSRECATCHNTSTWIIPNITELHQRGRFPLLGSHLSADCSQCHSGYADRIFEPKGIECYDCHKTDFEKSVDPNHISAGFSIDCSNCHSISRLQWAEGKFVHDFFPLTDGHQINECSSCHSSDSFTGLNQDCYGCHQQDFQNPNTVPNHITANFSQECKTCHTTIGWQPAQFDHGTTAFPLTGKHTTTSCESCHSSGYTGTSQDCYSCHRQDFQNPNNDPNHITANFSHECKTCHTTNGWLPTQFDHGVTAFPLTGKHITVSCESCHSSGYTGTSQECYSCHQNDFHNPNNDPNHITANFSHECKTCHTTVGWQPAQFDHGTTAFPLTGKHSTVSCESCHSSGYTGTSQDCYSCHQQDFQNPNNDPNHITANFSHECKTCHTTAGWQPAQFDHGITAFPLTGKHTTTSCESCHSNGYTGTSQVCYSCHQQDFQNPNNDPNHITANFSQECKTCHTTAGWQPAQFDHGTTAFPLTGKHSTVSCESCHSSGYTGTSQECYSCHQEDFQNPNNDPNHITANFSHECKTCHTTVGWQPAQFDHGITAFPLTGKHTTVSCESCHSSGYTGTSQECYSCHQEDFQNPNNDPNHITANYPTECLICHSTNGWSPSSFNHDNTEFPLTDKHTTVSCQSCHSSGYVGTPQECYSCHQEDFQNPNNDPNHITANYPTECSVCHSTNGWSPAVFNHDITEFPLTGKHTTVSCESCHSNGYTGTPTICYSCHQNDFQNPQNNPNHITSNFPTDCLVCHTTSGWSPSTFDHNNTEFPLTGRHTTVSCQACHTSGYVGTPQACYSCHQEDFQNPDNDPNHLTANFPTDCLVCHTTNGWSPSTFNHNNTGFPLTGRHSTVSCQSCHANGYAGTPQICYSCHQSDFQNPQNNPNHITALFPTDCIVCHTTNGWSPSSFNHDVLYFPIYSGEHRNEWNSCSDCHRTPNTFTTFSCIDCHEHRKSKMDSEHNGVNGYSYNSIACLNCHPNGTSDKLMNKRVLD